MSNYKEICDIFAKYISFNQISSLLAWDSQVMLPKKALPQRAKQQMLIYDVIENLIADPKLNNLIQNIDISKLDKSEKRNFELMHEFIWERSIIPKKLRLELQKKSLETEALWLSARDNNDYKIFNKGFKALIKLLREICTIKSQEMKISKYESLLKQYSKGVTEEKLDKIFNLLKEKLPALIDRVVVHQIPKDKLKKCHATLATQKEFVYYVAKKLSISPEWCRIDESVHPFTTGFKNDVRITTRYDKSNFTSALMGVIHESGHALYDHNLPSKYAYKLVGQDAGMAIHESQSLFFEMQIARSKFFCKFLTPIVNKYFAINFNENDLFSIFNFVEKSEIRVDADELTYPLHIIIRYEIERDLINSKIETDDIPEIWYEKNKNYLGISSTSLAKGCLQDIHWSDGSLGYFPTYSLGAIYAAQIAAKIQNIMPDFAENIANGKFMEIINILKNNIHAQGNLDDPDVIMKNFSGSSLDVSNYINYLQNKFL
jgi:carboxypeptidase Taq